MVANPVKGQKVTLAYRKALRGLFAFHGLPGVVMIPGRGKPRNHLVKLDGGGLVVVPCGHLNAVA